MLQSHLIVSLQCDCLSLLSELRHVPLLHVSLWKKEQDVWQTSASPSKGLCDGQVAAAHGVWDEAQNIGFDQPREELDRSRCSLPLAKWVIENVELDSSCNCTEKGQNAHAATQNLWFFIWKNCSLWTVLYRIWNLGKLWFTHPGTLPKADCTKPCEI